VVKREFRAPPAENGHKQGLKHDVCCSRRVPRDSRAPGLAHQIRAYPHDHPVQNRGDGQVKKS
jgi:hypothetical protein